MSVVIIDYGSGNLRSAEKSFERAAQTGDHPVQIDVTNDPEKVLKADRIVLPGVGAFGDCAAGLKALDGMVEALEEAVLQQAKPFMGICVGMQLMAERGLEHGDHGGLGWIEGQVEALSPDDEALKIPHMGWNELVIGDHPHPVLAGLPNHANVYFVHSFQFHVKDPRHQLAHVGYGGPVCAVVGRDNLIGTQFHPEKSQKIGLALIENFLTWSP